MREWLKGIFGTDTPPPGVPTEWASELRSMLGEAYLVPGTQLTGSSLDAAVEFVLHGPAGPFDRRTPQSGNESQMRANEPTRRFPSRRVWMWILAMTLCACRSGPRADGESWAQPQFDLVDHMPVTSIAWSPDGRYIVAASTQSNQIHVWDVPQRKFILGFERSASAAGFRELSWGPSGDLALCDGNLGTVKLYNSQEWSQPRVLGSDGDRACETSAFSSDGRELAVLGSLLRIYSVKDGHLLRAIDLVKEVSHGMPFAFKAIGYLPGTHDLLIGGDDFDSPDPHAQLTGHIWVLDAGEVLPHREFATYRYEPPNAPAQLISLAISPDGRRVATGTMTGAGAGQLGNVTAAVHILRIADGSLLAAPLDGRGVGYQQGIQFTPDGRYLLVALGGYKTTHDIEILDAKTFQQLATVHAASTVYGLAIQPDGRRFAVCAGSRIHIWSLPRRAEPR